MDDKEAWPKNYTKIPYSDDSSLNTLDVCLPRPSSPDDTNRYWIIFIHGGAWRDPIINSTSYFAPSRDRLLASKDGDRIAGYASVNYRLSSFPSHPTQPSDPSDPARNAKHPDHINDVLKALLYLQEQYGFEERYILVGHSCGATLAFQVAMKRFWGTQYESTEALELNLIPPLAVVGLAGLYDLPALVRNHADQPMYEYLVHNAFGNVDLASVSPTSGKYADTWADGRVVVLGQSPGDSLVEPMQVELQAKALQSCGWITSASGHANRLLREIELKGEHDEIWQTGDAARAVMLAIDELDGLST